MCREAHSEGITRSQIESALKILPIVGPHTCLSKNACLTFLQHPAMIRAVTNLKGAEDPLTTFFCLSNSNQVFIDTILKVTYKERVERILISDI
jgi:pyridoxal phosphate phosphatase PHOSPHO2